LPALCYLGLVLGAHEREVVSSRNGPTKRRGGSLEVLYAELDQRKITAKAKLGLVGYGRFGRMHTEAVSKIPDAALTSVCAGSEKSLQEARNETNLPVFLDYSDFLKSGDIDSVIIVTPNYTHAELALKALSEGKNVYLEKPMATTLYDAKKIVDSQRRTQGVVQIGFENRYSNFWASVKGILEREDIGAPVFGKIESWRFPFRGGSGGWKYDGQKVGHQLIEEAIHYADLSNWLFGAHSRPLVVSGFIDGTEPFAAGHLKSAFFVIEFDENERFIITDTLQGFGSDLSLTIAGESGAMTGAVRSDSDDSADVESYLKLRDKSDRTSTTKIQSSGQLADLTNSLRSFVGAVLKGEPQGATAGEGYTAQAICDAALTSMQSGRPETVRSLENGTTR
jgi:myo-inositol 2-dehydrogenase / D-chiro-inositol 1-dehydrogenase